jgi:hypothetical protein
MAGGRVRCGACLTVFVATERLVFASMPTEPQSTVETDLDRLLEELSEPDSGAGVRRVERDTTSDVASRIPKRAIAAVPPAYPRKGSVEGRREAESHGRLEPARAKFGTRTGVTEVPATDERWNSRPSVARPRTGAVGEDADAPRNNRRATGPGDSGLEMPAPVETPSSQIAENRDTQAVPAAAELNAGRFAADADVGVGEQREVSGTVGESAEGGEESTSPRDETSNAPGAANYAGSVEESGIPVDGSLAHESAIVETIELTLPGTETEPLAAPIDASHSTADSHLISDTISDTHGVIDGASPRAKSSREPAVEENERSLRVQEAPLREPVDEVCVPEFTGPTTVESVSVHDSVSDHDSARVPDAPLGADSDGRLRGEESVRNRARSTPLVLALEEEDAPLVRPRRRRWLVLAVIVAIAALGAQIMWFQFDTWSRDLRWRPIYEEMCARVGCRLPVMRALEALASRSLVVRTHPDVPGALLVDALIVNEAQFAQPFPVIELRFSSIDGRLVAGRRFKPSEYLAGELRGAEMIEPRTPVHIALEIDDPGAEAVNYVMVFR